MFDYIAVEILDGNDELFFVGVDFHPGCRVWLWSAAHDLGVGELRVARDVCGLVHVAGDDDLGFPGDEGIVPDIAAHFAVGIVVSVSVVRAFDDAFFFPAQGNVTANDAVRSIAKFGLGDDFLKPLCLFGAELLEGNAASEAGVVVRFIFAGVEADHGDWSVAEGVEGTSVRGRDHLGNAVGPLAANVVISPDEKHGASVGNVLPGRIEEGGDEPFFLMPVVAEVAILEQEIGSRSDEDGWAFDEVFAGFNILSDQSERASSRCSSHCSKKSTSFHSVKLANPE